MKLIIFISLLWLVACIVWNYPRVGILAKLKSDVDVDQTKVEKASRYFPSWTIAAIVLGCALLANLI